MLTKVRCFFGKDGQLVRTVIGDHDWDLRVHQPEQSESVRDIPVAQYLQMCQPRQDKIEAYAKDHK